MRSAEEQLQGVHHHQHLHQVGIHRHAGGLHDKAIGAAHVFEDLQADFAVREALEPDHAQFEAELLANLLGQRGVGGAGENLDAVRIHRADGFRRTGFGAAIESLQRVSLSARLQADRYCARLRNYIGNT